MNLKDLIKTDGHKTNLYCDNYENIFAFIADVEPRSPNFIRIRKSETNPTLFSDVCWCQDEIDEQVSAGLFPVVVDSYGNLHGIDQSVTTMEKVAEAIKDYMFKTNCFCGEAMHQCYLGITEAPSVLSTIIDDIMQVKHLGKLEGFNE